MQLSYLTLASLTNVTVKSFTVEHEDWSETSPQTHKSKTNLKQKHDEGNKDMILQRYHFPHGFGGS